jgi:hypothetical protein
MLECKIENGTRGNKRKLKIIPKFAFIKLDFHLIEICFRLNEQKPHFKQKILLNYY